MNVYIYIYIYIYKLTDNDSIINFYFCQFLLAKSKGETKKVKQEKNGKENNFFIFEYDRNLAYA